MHQLGWHRRFTCPKLLGQVFLFSAEPVLHKLNQIECIKEERK